MDFECWLQASKHLNKLSVGLLSGESLHFPKTTTFSICTFSSIIVAVVGTSHFDPSKTSETLITRSSGMSRNGSCSYRSSPNSEDSNRTINEVFGMIFFTSKPRSEALIRSKESRKTSMCTVM